MPLPKPPIPPAAEPTRKVFDPWNSVGLGHQRPEMREPDGWRASRQMKLNNQLTAGRTGGERVLVRRLGILGDQHAGHHEVPSDLVGQLLGQALKGLTGVLVEVGRADVVGDRRAVVDLLRCRTVALLLTPVAAGLVGLAVTAWGLRLAVAPSGRRLPVAPIGRLSAGARRLATATTIASTLTGRLAATTARTTSAR